MASWWPADAGAGAGALLTALLALAAPALLAWALRSWRAAPTPAPPPFRLVPDAEWRALFAAHREGAFARLLAGDATRTVRLGGCVATAHPAAVRALLLSRPHSLGRSWVYRALASVMPASDGILFMEGDAWRRRHSAFTPLLTGGNVRRYSLAMFASSLSALAEVAAGAGAGGNAHAGADGGSRARGYDLLTSVRAGAARFLLRFALGLQPHTPLGEQLEADLDAYARTAFEVFPFVGLWSQLAAYVYLWRTSARLAAGVRALVRATEQGTGGSAGAGGGDGVGSGGASGGVLEDATNVTYVAAAAAAADGKAAPATVAPATLLTRMLGWEGAAPAPARRAPSSSGSSSSERPFSPSELVSEVNHLHGAHKAVAFVTSCMLAELALPTPTAAAARRALVAELTAVCGRPPLLSQPCPTTAATAAGPAPLPPGLLLQALQAQAVAGLAAHAAATAGGGSCLPPSRLPDGWRPPDRSDLDGGRLPVFSRVWRETLRHHVVSMGVLRTTAPAAAAARANGDDGDGDGGDRGDAAAARICGVALPPRSDVLLLLHALHHDPELWGPDADSWRPDRWLAIDASRAGCGGASGEGAAVVPPDPLQGTGRRAAVLLPDPAQPLPFYPFLDGVRRCAGMHLAELEALVMTYTWLVLGDVALEGVVGGGGGGGRGGGGGGGGGGGRGAGGAATDGAGGEAAAAPPRDHPLLASGDPTARRLAVQPLAQGGGGGGEAEVGAPPGGWRLAKRADMFASLDGRLPFSVARWPAVGGG